LFAIAFIVFAAPFFWAIGCKPSQSNSGSAANSSSAGTQSEEVKVSSRTLTEWFAKQGVTSQEAKTVDAIIAEVRREPGYEGSPDDLRKLAVWADQKMDILLVRDYGLDDVSPFFAIRALVHKLLVLIINSEFILPPDMRIFSTKS
jgi:hypothetical protein